MFLLSFCNLLSPWLLISFCPLRALMLPIKTCSAFVSRFWRVSALKRNLHNSCWSLPWSNLLKERMSVSNYSNGSIKTISLAQLDKCCSNWHWNRSIPLFVRFTPPPQWVLSRKRLPWLNYAKLNLTWSATLRLTVSLHFPTRIASVRFGMVFLPRSLIHFHCSITNTYVMVSCTDTTLSWRKDLKSNSLRELKKLWRLNQAISHHIFTTLYSLTFTPMMLISSALKTSSRKSSPSSPANQPTD